MQLLPQRGNMYSCLCRSVPEIHFALRGDVKQPRNMLVKVASGLSDRTIGMPEVVWWCGILLFCLMK